MLRPIQVAPLSQRRMISPDPLVPNNMTQEQFIANQMAGNNVPLVQPTQQPPVQAPSPTARLSQLGQQGLQTAERFAKSITQSPAVQGLLGGGAQANQAGLLGDVQGQADLQGLFATLQAMGRPVRRGEDRLLGAVRYGREVQQQARQQGLQDIQTRLQLEEMQRARLQEERDRQQRALLNQYVMGATVQGSADPAQPLPEGTTGVLLPNAQQKIEENTRSPLEDTLAQRYDPYEIGRLTDAEKQDAARAMRLERAADMTDDADLSQEYRDRAQAINDRIGAKFLTREKRTTLSYDRRDQWDKTEYRPRVEQVAKARQLVELAKNPSGISDISLIFGLMKSLDPRSTVREGEADMVENAQGAFTRLMNIQNRVQEGRLLPDEAYPLIVEQALIVADAVEKDYKAAVDKRLAGIEGEGLDADIVVPNKTLGAPDVEATVSNLRQVLNLEQPAGTSTGAGADEIISIVGGTPTTARGGR